MAQYLSHAHVELILDGHRVTGYAEEDVPIEFDAGADRVNIQRGPDGGVYGTSSGMFGGPLTIRLAPTSVSTQWFIQRNEEFKQDQQNGTPTRVYSGTYADPVQGRSAHLEGGVLQTCPDMAMPGQTFEVVLYFEVIIGLVDGATFHPPFFSDTATA